jgi:hypothetical protein
MSLLDYPYLLVSLGLCLLAAGGYAVWPRGDAPGRHAVLAAALLGAPFALLSFEYIPKYWNPKVVLWLGAFSPEDMLFISAAAAIGWAVAACPFSTRLRHYYFEERQSAKALLVRFILGAAPGIAVSYAIKYGLPSQPVIVGTMWGLAVGGALLLWRKPRLWPLAGIGGAVFVAGYFVLLKLIFSVAPDLAAPWRTAIQPHVWVAGVPLQELLWAAGFGAVWPLFAGYCLDTQLASRAGQPSQSLPHTR